MTSLAVQLLLHVLRVTFAAYAVLVIVHFALQTFFAHRHHRAFLTLPFLLHRSRYMAFEVLVQTLLPLLLTLAIATSICFAILVDPGHLVHYALAITVMALVRCGYAIYRTRRLSFLLFVLYGFIHAALLVPLRMRALTTLTDNSWGTRTTVQRTTA